MKQFFPDTKNDSYLQGCVPVIIDFKSSKILVLCPVNKLKNLPQGLSYNAQGVVWDVNKDWYKSDIFAPDGNLFTIGGPYHQLLAKALTEAGISVT